MPAVRSGPLAAWARAWIAGLVSLDQVVDAVTAGDAPHTVTGLPGFEDDAVALLDLLVRWRRSDTPPQLMLPVPGDVRGLPGPAAFRAAALEVGEAVAAADTGAVPRVVEHAPSSAPPSVSWQAFATEPPPLDHLTVREAQYELTTAVRDCADALTEAQVGGARPDVAAGLGGARRAGERPNLPPGHPSPAVALLAQAERLQAVLDLVLDDPLGGAVDQHGIAARTAALRPLATAVRRARVAAFNAPLATPEQLANTGP